MLSIYELTKTEEIQRRIQREQRMDNEALTLAEIEKRAQQQSFRSHRNTLAEEKKLEQLLHACANYGNTIGICKLLTIEDSVLGDPEEIPSEDKTRK